MKGPSLAIFLLAALGVVCLHGLALGDPLAQKGAFRLTMVLSGDLPPYFLAAEAFTQALEDGGYAPVVTQRILGEDGSPQSIVAELKAAPPDLLLTLGTQASREVGLPAAPIPTIFALVLNPGASGLPPAGGSREHLTGVTMDIPLDTYLAELQSTLPEAKRIGLLAGPATQAQLPALTEATESRGMVLVTEALKGEREVSRALSALAPQVDVLIAKPDATVYTQGSTRYILLQTLRQGVPLMGPSEGFVDGGALLGIGLDYRALGSQAGALGLRVLEGNSPGVLPVEDPDTTRLLLNLRTARIIGVKVSESALERGEVRVR